MAIYYYDFRQARKYQKQLVMRNKNLYLSRHNNPFQDTLDWGDFEDNRVQAETATWRSKSSARKCKRLK